MNCCSCTWRSWCWLCCCWPGSPSQETSRDATVQSERRTQLAPRRQPCDVDLDRQRLRLSGVLLRCSRLKTPRWGNRRDPRPAARGRWKFGHLRESRRLTTTGTYVAAPTKTRKERGMSEGVRVVNLGWLGTLPICPYCKNEIDPDSCWCGSGKSGHPYDLGHSFVPMGCDCSRSGKAGAP